MGLASTIAEWLLMAAAAVAADAPPPPLPPEGPWIVEAEDNLCLLSRGFGPAESRVTLGFQPLFLAKTMEMLVLTRDISTDQRGGDASVTIGENGQPLKAGYISVPLPGQRRLTRLTVSSDVMAALPTASLVTVKAGKMVWFVRLGPTDKALRALDGCQRDLLRSWGVDPALVTEELAPRMAASAARYFGPDAYPPEAQRAGVHGRVVTVLGVDAAGRVSDCRVVATAGDVLNAATCLAARRIRFTPGHDAAGKAAASIYVLPVRWVLPRD